MIISNEAISSLFLFAKYPAVPTRTKISQSKLPRSSNNHIPGEIKTAMQKKLEPQVFTLRDSAKANMRTSVEENIATQIRFKLEMCKNCKSRKSVLPYV